MTAEPFWDLRNPRVYDRAVDRHGNEGLVLDPETVAAARIEPGAVRKVETGIHHAGVSVVGWSESGPPARRASGRLIYRDEWIVRRGRLEAVVKRREVIH